MGYENAAGTGRATAERVRSAQVQDGRRRRWSRVRRCRRATRKARREVRHCVVRAVSANEAARR
eukprot:2834400-Pleurochrysis_carterae.AAC.1